MSEMIVGIVAVRGTSTQTDLKLVQIQNSCHYHNNLTGIDEFDRYGENTEIGTLKQILANTSHCAANMDRIELKNLYI